jgi:exosome complex component RRP42
MPPTSTTATSSASASTNPLSPAELSYLHTSLSLSPPIRPDSRKNAQFRPLTAELDILPSTHGSSRLVWPDGSECIVGVKAEVERTTNATTTFAPRLWFEVSVEVAGARDDDPLAVFLSSSVSDMLGPKLSKRLEIGKNWHWKLYIDVDCTPT